jgi:hypothetical protein
MSLPKLLLTGALGLLGALPILAPVTARAELPYGVQYYWRDPDGYKHLGWLGRFLAARRSRVASPYLGKYRNVSGDHCPDDLNVRILGGEIEIISSNELQYFDPNGCRSDYCNMIKTVDRQKFEIREMHLDTAYYVFERANRGTYRWQDARYDSRHVHAITNTVERGPTGLVLRGDTSEAAEDGYLRVSHTEVMIGDDGTLRYETQGSINGQTIPEYVRAGCVFARVNGGG